MNLRLRIQESPDGVAYPNATVRVRQWSDSVTIATLISDDDGFIAWESDGHPEPYYLHLTDVPGGDKFWSGSDVMVAGALSPREVPVALRVLGDGVIRNVTSELAVSLVDGGPSVSVAPGAANVAGHPVVFYADTAFSISRPVSSTRIDRIVIRLNPEGSSTTPGKAEVVVLDGTEGGAAPSLTQSADTYEMSLAQLTVPVAGAVTLTDERTGSGEKLDVADVADDDAATTTSVGGEALGPSITLTLPRSATYDIAATLSARQTSTAGATGWQLQATYGPTFNGLALSSPSQVAIDSTGRVLIADTGNDRLVILTSAGAYSTGATGLSGITGVCTDASDNIYVVYDGGANIGIKKYNSSLTSQWTNTISGTSAAGAGQCTTDGTSFWLAASNDRRVYERFCTSGNALGNFGAGGSTDGKFAAGGPYGIANDGTYLYVSDPGNSRVQKFTLAGAYVDQWSSASPFPCAVDASGDIIVGSYLGSVINRYTNGGVFVDQFVQTRPLGIAVASGDVVWANDSIAGTIAKWDEAVFAGGYGQIAIEIDSVVGTYSGIGQRDGAVSVVETGSKAGAGTVVIRAFGKRTADTMTLASLVLSARAVPRA